MTDALASAAIGTASDDLIAPCGSERSPAPADPPAPKQLPSVALALSGGGFRATLSALGVLRLLSEVGLLERVRYSSSVSGGSVANALFAMAYEALAAHAFSADAFDRHVLAPAVDGISRHSLKFQLLAGAWRTVGSTTRTDLLARAFD